jgi:hypothetical protein
MAHRLVAMHHEFEAAEHVVERVLVDLAALEAAAPANPAETLACGAKPQARAWYARDCVRATWAPNEEGLPTRIAVVDLLDET